MGLVGFSADQDLWDYSISMLYFFDRMGTFAPHSFIRIATF